VFWFVNSGILWFKRTQILQAVRKNALTNKDAGLAYTPTQRSAQELQEIPAITLEDEIRLQTRPLALAPKLNDSISSRKPRNEDRIAGKRLTRVDCDPFPELAIAPRSILESLSVFHGPVRDSGWSDDTIGSDMTLGTMISMGEAVPIRMALHTPQPRDGK
jgi:hypothetical protein